MADPARVVRQLGLQRSAEVTAKAAEFCRLTSIKFGNGGLGQVRRTKHTRAGGQRQLAAGAASPAAAGTCVALK